MFGEPRYRLHGWIIRNLLLAFFCLSVLRLRPDHTGRPCHGSYLAFLCESGRDETQSYIPQSLETTIRICMRRPFTSLVTSVPDLGTCPSFNSSSSSIGPHLQQLVNWGLGTLFEYLQVQEQVHTTARAETPWNTGTLWPQCLTLPPNDTSRGVGTSLLNEGNSQVQMSHPTQNPITGGYVEYRRPPRRRFHHRMPSCGGG